MVDQNQPKEDDQSYIRENKETGEQHLYVDVLILSLLQQYMGTALDLARISPMTDRQLTQFTRKMKDKCYQIAEDSGKILKKFGYELGDTRSKKLD